MDEYGSNATVKFDGMAYSGSELREKCKNKAILGSREFSLVRDGHELFGFHDGPDNFWASLSELAFVETLAAEKITRFEILSVKPSLIERIRRRLLKS